MSAQKLTYKWNSGDTLSAAEMTAIKNVINTIIDDVSSIVASSTDGLTKQDIKDAIDEYDTLAESARALLEQSLTNALQRISSIENGNINIDADNEVIKGLKNDLYSTFIRLGLAEEDENGLLVTTGTFATTSQIDALNQLISGLQSTSSATLTQVGLIANWYRKVTDENGNEKLVPVYDGASIVAAINDKGQSSVKIDADRIDLNGYVKADDLDVANEIKGKTITGVTLNGGSINIGEGNFTVDSEGNVVAKSITLRGQGNTIIATPGNEYTLPPAMDGNTVWVINTAPNTSSDPANYITLHTNSTNEYIQYMHDGQWSKGANTSFNTYQMNYVKYIFLVADGTNWYILMQETN